MDYQRLEKIGLTPGESKVYLALLKTGTSTIGKIIQEAQVSNSKVYDILDRLNKKGLVGTALKNNTRYFEAKDPSRIREFITIKEKEIQEQKKEIEKIIPELKQIIIEPTQEAEILQGINGIKTFNETALARLQKGDTIYVLGVPKEAEQLKGFFQDWHERRVEKGAYCKILYNQETEEMAKKRKQMPLTEVRFLPKNLKTPAPLSISNEYVATELFSEKPMAIVIKNQKIADSYVSYFKLLWEQSK